MVNYKMFALTEYTNKVQHISAKGFKNLHDLTKEKIIT